MKKFPKPWYRRSRGVWYVTLNGKQHNLGSDREAAFDRYRHLMANPPRAEALPTNVAPSTYIGVHDTVCESADAETRRARQEAGTAGENQSSHPLPHGRGSLFSTDSQPDCQSASCTTYIVGLIQPFMEDVRTNRAPQTAEWYRY